MSADSFCTALLCMGLAGALPPVLSGADAVSDRAAKASAANYNLPLWEDGKVPLAKGDGPLDKPLLTVFLPPVGKANGTSVVIAPGGSNIMLMYGGEGMEIAERYNDWGVTAFVLTYRLSPRYGEDARVMDAKRAIQLVRSRSAEFRLDPKRVGFIGFSAGSNLGRAMMSTVGPGEPNASNPIDRMSSRPDYLALIYGPGRATPTESLKDFPPTFLCAAEFDKGTSIGSAQLFMDLTKAGAIAEVHLYQQGRHGFGSGFGDPNFEDWMPRLQHFLKVAGLMTGTGK
jgi:acetyl esterase/lipase